MKLYNIKIKDEIINFCQAVKQGLGKKKGLFFPEKIPEFTFDEINKMLEMDFINRSYKIINAFINEEIHGFTLHNILKKSFSFPIAVKKISENISVLELFHGPTLAFKDFGCRFMAEVLSAIKKNNEKFLILTATSGDTGAAVAHAFYGIKNITVVILYPAGKISVLQEKIFCTLGNNIKTLSVDSDFDTCQEMVKKAFEDKDIKNNFNINSANSINISRLLGQICYYFEALSQLPKKCYDHNNLVVSVPSGNFGNLTAGLLAKSCGLPIKRFIAATNVNDTIPRFLSNGIWQPKKTISTISNAMDISKPNNWIRIEEIFHRKKEWHINDVLSSISIDDDNTKLSVKNLYYNNNYISDPHSAIAYQALKNNLKKDEYGLFLSTAHPAKFKDTVDTILNKNIDLPKSINKYLNLKILSEKMKPDFLLLKKYLFNLFESQ